VVPRRLSISGQWGSDTLLFTELLVLDAVARAFPSAHFLMPLSLHDVLLMPAAVVLRQLLAAPREMAFSYWRRDRAVPLAPAAVLGNDSKKPSSLRGAPAPFRLQRFFDDSSFSRFDLPAAPPAVQATLWNASVSGIDVELAGSQWVVLPRAALLAMLRAPLLVELLFSLKHTPLAEEHFFQTAGDYVSSRRGEGEPAISPILYWRQDAPVRRYSAWQRDWYAMTAEDAQALLRLDEAVRPYTARKVYWDAAAGAEAGLWRLVWSASQPACLAPGPVEAGP